MEITLSAVTFFYKDSTFEFSPDTLTQFFVEDLDFYQNQGDVFSSFRITFKTIVVNRQRNAFIKDPLALSAKSVDALVLKQISELNIDYSDLKSTMQKIKNIINKHKSERWRRKPISVFLSLFNDNKNFVYPIPNYGICKQQDLSTHKIVNIFSLTRTFADGSASWINDFVSIDRTTKEKKHIQVDQEAIQTLMNSDTHTGSHEEWKKNIHKIVNEAQLRISNSTGAEKVSTPSSTPPKLPKKQPLNK